MRTQVQFAPKNRESVLDEASTVFGLVSNLLKEKQGDLEVLRDALYKFNAASKKAHRELLAL